MVTSLTEIAKIAIEKTEENIAFQKFLKQQPTDEIDKQVKRLDVAITPNIDCTICGNCCKSLMINVTEQEADKLAAHLQVTRVLFDETYIEKGSQSMMLMNTIPCNFLADNKCTVYEHRFAGCKEFPGLHLPHFSARLFTTFMHYERCPIIFNVVEALKEQTNFLLPK